MGCHFFHSAYKTVYVLSILSKRAFSVNLSKLKNMYYLYDCRNARENKPFATDISHMLFERLTCWAPLVGCSPLRMPFPWNKDSKFSYCPKKMYYSDEREGYIIVASQA